MTIEFKKISNKDILVKDCAALVRKHSWGMDYPVNPLDEFLKAEYIIAALENKKIIGCASITRVASPDKIDNGKLWFADAVVLPKYRRLGIFKNLYQKTLAYLKKYSDPAFACTNNLIIVSFLLEHGWDYYRTTKDESGGLCLVFRLK